MQCIQCNEPAVIDRPLRCRAHFIEEFEARVMQTIVEYDMVHTEDNILVAASGGKDSLTVMVLLAKWFPNVTAVAIDEGIADYREHTLNDLRKVCKEHNIRLLVKSYTELTGFTLDEILKKHNFSPCNVCGAFRRHLLSISAKEFDAIATGHNTDDEAQAALMNLLKGNTEIFPRSGPISGHGAEGFTKRVKPLYFCTEKEIMTYAFLHGLVHKFTECPNITGSYRDVIREELNKYERSHPGAKKNVLQMFLKTKSKYPPVKPMQLKKCDLCGEPCSGRRCKSCQFLVQIKA